MKRCSLAFLAPHPDPAAMLFNSSLADRKPDARARYLCPVQPFEDAENAGMVLGTDPDAIVLNGKPEELAVMCGADADTGGSQCFRYLIAFEIRFCIAAVKRGKLANGVRHGLLAFHPGASEQRITFLRI